MSKVIQNGSSHMVIIPQEIIQKLGWNKQTNVYVGIDSLSGKVTIEKIKEVLNNEH